MSVTTTETRIRSLSDAIERQRSYYIAASLHCEQVSEAIARRNEWLGALRDRHPWICRQDRVILRLDEYAALQALIENRLQLAHSTDRQRSAIRYLLARGLVKSQGDVLVVTERGRRIAKAKAIRICGVGVAVSIASG